MLNSLLRKKKKRPPGVFFVTQKTEPECEGGKLNAQSTKEKGGERVFDRACGQRLAGAEEFMVDLSLFATALQ